MTTKIKFPKTRQRPIAEVGPGDTFIHHGSLFIMTDREFTKSGADDGSGWVVRLSNGEQYSLHGEVQVIVVDIDIEVNP